MFEQTTSFWDIGIVAIIIGCAGYYLYRRLFGKKSGCASGCDSCSSASKKPKL